MHRSNHRSLDALRPVRFETETFSHAPGAVLVAMGDTQVLCTASVVDGVPRFLRDKRQGWLTAEYGMLPTSTHTRVDREAARGRQSGRTLEIQRLIGRSLRSVVDLSRLPDMTVVLDCDVLKADGGTRTAAISGSYVALARALQHLQYNQKLTADPLIGQLAAVSVGVVKGQACLDLDYQEDSQADTDMNVVMTREGRFVELQGTAEREAYSRVTLNQLLDLAEQGIREIMDAQDQACHAPHAS